MALVLVDGWVTDIGYTSEAVPQGAIVKSGPYAPTYLNDVAGVWQLTPPSKVPLGKRVGINVLGQNIGDLPQLMQIEVTIAHPNGNAAATRTEVGTINPSDYLGSGDVEAVVTQYGTYKAVIALYADLA